MDGGVSSTVDFAPDVLERDVSLVDLLAPCVARNATPIRHARWQDEIHVGAENGAVTLPQFRLERYFARFEFEVPYLLGSSDVEPLTLDELLALEPDALEGLRSLPIGYTETHGSSALRHAVARLYDSAEPDDVVVHAAAVEVVFVYMNAILKPGDRVIVQTPCFQPLAEIARSIGSEVVPWRGRPEQGWEPDLGELERLLWSPTKLVVINFPHNPTGLLPSRAYFEKLLDLAALHEVRVFSDEIFRLLEHEPARRLPAACDLYDRAASLGGMSKAFGLAGLRIGWLATRDAEAVRAVVRFKDFTTTCAGAINEALAAIALRNWRKIIDRNLERVRANVDLFRRAVEEREDLWQWAPPLAGTVAFPRIECDEDLVALSEDLARTEGVLIIPGALFDQPEHVRIGFGRTGFPEGLERLMRFLDARPA